MHPNANRNRINIGCKKTPLLQSLSVTTHSDARVLYRYVCAARTGELLLKRAVFPHSPIQTSWVYRIPDSIAFLPICPHTQCCSGSCNCSATSNQRSTEQCGCVCMWLRLSRFVVRHAASGRADFVTLNREGRPREVRHLGVRKPTEIRAHCICIPEKRGKKNPIPRDLPCALVIVPPSSRVHINHAGTLELSP